LDFLDGLRALLLRDDFIWYEAVLLEPFVLLPPHSVMSLPEFRHIPDWLCQSCDQFNFGCVRAGPPYSSLPEHSL